MGGRKGGVAEVVDVISCNEFDSILGGEKSKGRMV